MTVTEHASLQAALSAFAAGEGGSRVLVVWQRVRRGLAVAGLDAVETERVSKLRRPDDRDRYLTAHHLARRVAGEYLTREPVDVVFDRTCLRCGEQHGAPSVVVPPGFSGGAPPSVSLTHSGEIVGVALRLGGPVGLDVEEHWPDDREALLADMVRSPGDAPDDVSGDVPELGLRELWVAKEAVLKAAGTGLAASMTEVALASPYAEFGGRRWWWAQVPVTGLAGYAGALAGLGEAPKTVDVVSVRSAEW